MVSEAGTISWIFFKATVSEEAEEAAEAAEAAELFVSTPQPARPTIKSEERRMA